jgi:lycopene beta-cyclase
VFLANRKGDWEPSISKKWDSALFANADFKEFRFATLSIQYGSRIRFLQSSFDFIFKKHQLCQSKVTDINELENHAYVATETDSYTCDTILIVFTTKRE